jgi:predicted TIM-barrel fold metal-dependent hydrolase
MKEYGPLMDCHVHIDEIKVHNPEIASYFDKGIGDIKWKGVNVESHTEHIKKDNLEVIYAIYEDPNSLITLRNTAPNCDIRGMYFIREPENPDIEFICDLYRNGLIQGIKVHPVIDNFPLTSENLKIVLGLSRKLRIPILYHSDDRNQYWKLTSPELQESIVKENPDITFLVGHGGAYAKPRLVGNNPATIAYWEGNKTIVSRRNLVIKALELTTFNDNAYYDLTIATNAIKAGIIADFVNRHPGSEEKIIVGTDFPIGLSKATSQLNALAKAGMRPNLVQKVASNRI